MKECSFRFLRDPYQINSRDSGKDDSDDTEGDNTSEDNSLGQSPRKRKQLDNEVPALGHRRRGTAKANGKEASTRRRIQEMEEEAFGFGASWTNNDQDVRARRLAKMAFKETLTGNATEEDNQSVEEDDMGIGNDDEVFDPYAEPSDEDEDGQYNAEPHEGNVEVDTERPPSNQSMKEFKSFVRSSHQHYSMLKPKEVCAIKLMHKLYKKRATLDTYDAVMEWHLRECGKLEAHVPLGKSKFFVSRKTLMKKLIKRYDLGKMYATPVERLLPHTKSKVNIYRRHARDLVQSLLVDPRWKDDDWVFWENDAGEMDPFAPPPEDLDHIADINTGRAYLETYKKLIKKPRQILVPLPLYIDGAVTGQFDKLQVTALKMSLGILNRKARDKEHAWKALGLVCNYTKEESRGQTILVESEHLAAKDVACVQTDIDGVAGTYTGKEVDPDKAVDYHFILAELMSSLNELIEEGMMFDLRYKGKIHKNCELVFFVPFVKCDGDEGDKLCLHFRSRGKGVQNLCRFCTVPNHDTDNHKATHPYKTEPMLKKLYERQDFVALRKLSQIGAQNAFHGLRFGLHNNRGIHGATPTELLHAILLGIFKYTRDCFFAQLGKTSANAVEINSVAIQIGRMMSRQSDRDRPRTKFAKGILKGKLMAKEYTGVLLLMSALLRIRKTRDILQSARKKSFREDWQRRDWTMLVETLLQWEAYLCVDEMPKAIAKRLQKKHRYVMFLLKKIANRTKRMGFKIMKYHAIIHIAQDILDFGVPYVVDTGSNESHHKTTKAAAQLTQKDLTTFEKQCSNRLDDMHVLDMAMEEINGRPLWKYFDGYVHPPRKQKPQQTKTCGMQFVVFKKENATDPTFKIITRMEGRANVQMDKDLVDMFWHLQQLVKEHEPTMAIFAEHHRQGVIFRSHPNFRGKGPWRDWVMIEWSTGKYPAKIWGFIDLTSMADGVSIQLEDGAELSNNVYAIVENAEPVLEEKPLSDLWSPIKVDTDRTNGSLSRVFTVVDVEAFAEPIVVIPNIGAKHPDPQNPTKKFIADPDEYLLMTARCTWSDIFEAWVKQSHRVDEEEMKEPEPEPPTDDEEDDEEESDSEDEESVEAATDDEAESEEEDS